MQIVSYVLSFMSAFINLWVFIKCYSVLNNKKLKLNVWDVLFMILISSANFMANLYLCPILKIVTFITLVVIMLKLIYKDRLINIIVVTMLFYILLMILDFLWSFLIVFLTSVLHVKIMNSLFFKAMLTICLSINYLLIFKIKKFLNFYQKLINLLLININHVYYLVLFLIYIAIMVITYLHFDNNTFLSFMLVFVLVTVFMSLSIFLFIQFFKNKTAMEEQKSLLEIMHKYEGILEKDRINRHEMLNNLLALKSFKNKVSKDYEDLLNDIVNDYQSKKTNTYSNLYKLPSGIKGIVYYKMANIVDKDINFNSEISNQVYEYFDKLDAKLYFKVCKIIGILLDNAIEASMMTKKKLIFIEMFVNSENSITVLIENSTLHEVNINEISKKGFSTKGENRGYGLYLVNSMVKSTNSLALRQYMFNGNFVTELKITL